MKKNVSSYLYGITDEKFIKVSLDEEVVYKRQSGIQSYKYRTPAILKVRKKFDPHDISIVFKTSPETLLNIAAKVVDALPLPSVFTWTIEDICRWLRNYGYPQYQNTFRENYVNGRSMLLLDAAALSAMNIKDFDHIRHIAYGIRNLYFFELTKFGRSISLAPDYHYELYKLFRVKNGTKYDNTKRTELWRRMQLIREPRKYLDHWDTLERHLKMEREPKYTELFGGVRRTCIFHCTAPKYYDYNDCVPTVCNCMPPCECQWTARNLRYSWRMADLPSTTQVNKNESVLTLLKSIWPQKYGYVSKDFHEANLQHRVHKFKANARSSSVNKFTKLIEGS